MHAEGFTNDTIEDGETADFFVLHGAPGSVWLEEVLDLFLVDFLTVQTNIRIMILGIG